VQYENGIKESDLLHRPPLNFKHADLIHRKLAEWEPNRTEKKKTGDLKNPLGQMLTSGKNWKWKWGN
jgi:hypothetical protein